MANFPVGPNILAVDLIDDGHADTITFHDLHDTELHRAPIVGREPIVYAPDRDGLIHAKAWTGEDCIYVFETLMIYRGATYTVTF